MNGLARTTADLQADDKLATDLKSILSEIGGVVSDSAYEEVLEEGAKIELQLKGIPDPAVDEETLNQKWREAYVLLRQAFRQGLMQSQWQQILEIGLDYNYAPTKFRNHIARYWQSVEAIIEGREPQITGRESGIEKLENADAEPRRMLRNILDKEKPRFAFSKFKKAAKALVNEERDEQEVSKIVLSCNRGNVTGKNGEFIARTVLDLYKSAASNVQSDIITLVHVMYDEGNLRGSIKKVLTSFALDGEHPFWFLQAKHGVAPAIKSAHVPDKVGDRIMRKGC